MKLWKTPNASVEELAEQLAAAETALQQAQEAEQSAEAAFDSEANAATEKRLREARSAREIAAEYAARAQRLLEAGQAREAEAERQRLLARKAELEQQTTRQAVLAAAEPLTDREIEVLRQLVEVRVAKVALRDSVSRREHELFSIKLKLGEPTPTTHQTGESGYAVAYQPVAARLEEIKLQLLDDDLRRSLWAALEPRPSHTSQHYAYGLGVHSTLFR